MLIHDLKKSAGRSKSKVRVGRGNGSKGNYCGKGVKGQKSRSGGGIPAWFEGGQTPLHRRLPKLRGFKRYHKLLISYEIVNLSLLEQSDSIESGSSITKVILSELGLISSALSPVKVLGSGEITKKLTFSGIDKISLKAVKKIEEAGGSIE